MVVPTGVVVCGRADGPHRPIRWFRSGALNDSIGPDSGRGATGERRRGEERLVFGLGGIF